MKLNLQYLLVKSTIPEVYRELMMNEFYVALQGCPSEHASWLEQNIDRLFSSLECDMAIQTCVLK